LVLATDSLGGITERATVEGQASISSEVLGRYAADAAREVDGVRELVASQLYRHRGVRVMRGEEDGTTVEIHLDVEWGSSIPELGRAVQSRVGDYLERMAGARPTTVNIIVDAIGPTP
jgi:uncharacterized alkaline shock family protein YloU